MYAVIFSGGKQYRVQVGDVLCLETLEVAVGEMVTFEHVMAKGEGKDLVVGRPYVQNASVTAKVLSHGRHDKVEILKFRRRKHHMKRQGHRQNYTQVEITSIA